MGSSIYTPRSSLAHFCISWRRSAALIATITTTVGTTDYGRVISSGTASSQGYNSSIDPGVDEFFAAVSFRYGHSSFSQFVRMIGPNWVSESHDPLLLRDIIKSKPFSTTNHEHVQKIVTKYGGIEVFLRGLTMEPAKASDASIVDDLNLWSLATSVLDIQRGRDVRIPPYNQVRVAMGLPRVESLEELVGGKNDDDHHDDDDMIVLEALRSLYDDDIDMVDAYVGGLVEEPIRDEDPLGPLFLESIHDQFTRLRGGDRLWYANLYSPEVYQDFPTISDIIQLVCEGMDDFPSDAFKMWNGPHQEESCDSAAPGYANHLSLLSGTLNLGWSVDIPTAAEQRDDPLAKQSIDVTLTAMSPMNGPGHLGVGWRSQTMHGAEIWLCTVAEDALDEYYAKNTLPSSCGTMGGATAKNDTQMFSCCLAEVAAEIHAQPRCSNSKDRLFYELEVVEWCLAEESVSVTVRAPLCDHEKESGPLSFSVLETSLDEQKTINCFRLSSEDDNNRMDFIVAYNPNEVAHHGYMRRTAAQVDLTAGILTQSEIGTADDGLIATHGVFMMIAWMLVAPGAIFIARYLKTWSWRVVIHISLMTFTGSLMIPLLVGVEASVGATNKKQDHSIVGLALVVVYFVMAFAGRIRYLKLSGQRVGKKYDLFSLVVHKFGGIAIVAAAWYNCYTGLIRIGPEDSYFQMVLMSSKPLGYNMPVFGFIRQYIFFPYIALVCAVFGVAEVRRWRFKNASHAKEMQGMMDGTSHVWDDLQDDLYEEMTMEDFLEATRMGTELCIVDGYVLDITNFAEAHPGGKHLLRYAKGADITEEFAGLRAVDGLTNCHSRDAVGLMKNLIKAVLVDDAYSGNKRTRLVQQRSGGGGQTLGRSKRSRRRSSFRARVVPSVFRCGQIVDLDYLTPEIEMTSNCKPVILIRMALPIARLTEEQKRQLSLPGCAFTFRIICDKTGMSVERKYTPVKLKSSRSGSPYHSNENECVLDFIISLIPGGKMSTVLLDLRKGKSMLARGPSVNPSTVETLTMRQWDSVVFMASGTGIANCLQLVEFYMSRLEDEDDDVDTPSFPSVYLVWLIKGPEYDYGKSLDLEGLVEHSGGRFRYTVIHSVARPDLERKEGLSSRQIERPLVAKRFRTILDKNNWNFQSLAEKSKNKLWMLSPFTGREKVKRMVVRKSIECRQPSVRHPVVRQFSTAAGISSRWVQDESTRRSHFFDDFDDRGPFSGETWLGPTENRTRDYDKDLLLDLFASIDSAAEANDLDSLSSCEQPGTNQPVINKEAGERTDKGPDHDASTVGGQSTAAAEARESTSFDNFSNEPGTGDKDSKLQCSYHPDGSNESDLWLKVASVPEKIDEGGCRRGDKDDTEEIVEQAVTVPTQRRRLEPNHASVASSDDLLEKVAEGFINGETSGESTLDEEAGCGAYSTDDDEESKAKVYFSKRLVAISGAPSFEHDTRMILLDMGIPENQLLSFHGQL